MVIKISAILSLFLLQIMPLTAQQGFLGEWEGKMDVQGNNLHIALTLENINDSTRAELFILEQNIKNYPATTVSTTTDSLFLGFPDIQVRIEGSLTNDSTLQATWIQGPYQLALPMHKVEEAYARPQDPEKPFPYIEREIEIPHPQNDNIIAGTLTLPDTIKPHPLVILISGSGKQNRDSEIFGHRPFLVISDYLTRQGIAVFRYDDRGAGASTGDFFQATSADFAMDVERIIAYFKTHPSIDPKNIGCLGHSEGGLIAPLVAQDRDDVAFLVLIAAPGVPIPDLMVKQTELVLRGEGNDEETIAKTVALNRKIYELTASIENQDSLYQALQDLIKAYYDDLSEESKQALGSFQQFYFRSSQQVSNPWFRWFIRYRPAPVLKKIQCPVLALNGELDTQVSAKENLAGIRRALEESGNDDVLIRSFPGLNHLMQTAQTGAFSEYAEIKETFSPQALELIGAWINSHVQ